MASRPDSQSIGEQQQQYHREEFRTGIRAVPMTPLMNPAHPHFAIIRRHGEALSDWFARETGWMLHIERDCVRLYKRPTDLADATRGLPGYDRRRYALLCLACAVLERTQLAQAGACLHYHGDFDWPGLRIGNHVMREWAARAWRFAAADYVDAALISPRPGRPLDSAPAVASWDAGLAPAMQGHQLSISEESVAETLLRDLASGLAIPDDGAPGPYGEELISRPAETSG
jgi:hypothetical protein